MTQVQTKEKHVVVFQSPGTFFSESTTRDVESWDPIDNILGYYKYVIPWREERKRKTECTCLHTKARKCRKGIQKDGLYERN